MTAAEWILVTMKPFSESSHSIHIRRPVGALTVSGLSAALLLVLGSLALRLTGSPVASLAQAGLPSAANGAPLASTQAATATISFDQPVYVVAPGDLVTASLMIADAEQVGAWELRLAMDASRVELAQVSAGDFLSSTGRAVSFLGPLQSGAPGQVALGSYSYGAQAGVDGMGALAQLIFQVDALASGSIDLTLSDLLLVQVAGNAVSAQPVLGQGAVIQVSGDAALGGAVFLALDLRWELVERLPGCDQLVHHPAGPQLVRDAGLGQVRGTGERFERSAAEYGE